MTGGRLRRAALGSLALVLGACQGGTATAPPAPPTTPPVTSAARPPATRPVPERFRGAVSEMYERSESWLCRPDLPAASDHCRSPNLDATVIPPDGRTSVLHAAPPAPARVDCFYVYPTVSFQGDNKSITADIGPEILVVGLQAARFRSVCNLYAPLYRQATLSGLRSPDAVNLAYGDVHAAFSYYMARFNQGRPFVLIGHSQGSIMLTRLLREELDNDPDLRSRLVSALLVGGFVHVPPGKDTGGTFSDIPLCRRPEQIGCAVAYNTFSADDPPGQGALFGRTDSAGNVDACTNPAALDGGTGTLRPFTPSTGHWITGRETRFDTPYVSLPDAFTARCAQRDGFSYLEATKSSAAGDVRDLSALSTPSPPLPGWGLHVVEVNLTIGNLIDLVATQSAAMG